MAFSLPSKSSWCSWHFSNVTSPLQKNSVLQFAMFSRIQLCDLALNVKANLFTQMEA